MISKKFKRLFAIFKQAYQLNQWSYGCERFSPHYPIIKHLMFWRIGIKLTEWQANIWAAVISINLKVSVSCNLYQFKRIGEDFLFWYLAMATG